MILEEILMYENIFLIISISLLAFLGSSIRIIMSVFIDPTHNETLKRKIAKIFISTIVASIISYSLYDWYTQLIGPKLWVALTFILGVIGFELAIKLSDIDRMIGFIQTILGVLKEAKSIFDSKQSQSSSSNTRGAGNKGSSDKNP